MGPTWPRAKCSALGGHEETETGAPDVDWAPLSHPRYIRCSTLRLANLANVDCLGLAGLLAGADLELDSIALIKGLEAVHLDGAKVNEDIGFGIRPERHRE